ncbi:MAG: DUF952 domain-containing protein [Sphingomonadales bacterium]|nr:DUF952 domain-containing protein [Sphingomonadales bacterium]
MTQTAFKILTASQWTQFREDGVFLGAPIDLADGYIHLSAADQLQGTLDKHFVGQSELVIAEIDLSGLGETVRWEGVARGRSISPHLWPLPISAVIKTRNTDGG